MAKTKTRTRTVVVRGRSRKRKTTLPLTIVLPLASSGMRLYSESKSIGIQAATENMIGYWTSYNPRKGNIQGWSRISNGIGPVMIGAGIHKLANILGVNRALSSARIPLIRV